MPNKSEVGFADYVLYGNDGRALAVIEAKRTCTDVSKGRQQAKLYADLLEKQYGRRPIQFLTNGFEIRIVDNQYPERSVAAFYSKQDLEKLFNLRRYKASLKQQRYSRTLLSGSCRQGSLPRLGEQQAQGSSGYGYWFWKDPYCYCFG